MCPVYCLLSTVYLLMDVSIPDMNWTIISPALIVTGTALVAMIADMISPRGSKAALLSFVGIMLAIFQSIRLWGSQDISFSNMVALDNYTIFFNIIFLIGTALTIGISLTYVKREKIDKAEYYILLLLATVGMMLLAAGTDLIMIFLGLELLSISQYILAGFMRREPASNEAALKYFLLGAFATGFLLYGMALVYGGCGTTNLVGITDYISSTTAAESPLLLVGGFLILVGLGFKIALVPFHMWVPDVYEGAPTAITAFISAGPKAAGFAALLRVFVLTFEAMQGEWIAIVWVIAALTMTVGNVIAISQNNIKRMLAYSSIAHAGYALVALVASAEEGVSSLIFYLLVYTLMNIGAFGILIMMGREGAENLTFDSYSGLGFKRPVVALLMTLFMMSLAGFPPTAGFIGKFYIFRAAIKAGFTGLVIVAVVNSVISVYYYLRVVVVMYMSEPEEVPSTAVGASTPVLLSLTLALCALGVIEIGIMPSWLLELAVQSALSIM